MRGLNTITMTTKIKWRLKALPETHEIAHLVKEGILTKEEAREILISLETDDDRDKKSLQDEIKFLRQLVESLSSSRSKIIETIRYVEKPYINQQWWPNYQFYCANDTAQNGLIATGTSNTVNALYTTTGSSNLVSFNTDSPEGFSDIKTF